MIDNLHGAEERTAPAQPSIALSSPLQLAEQNWQRQQQQHPHSSIPSTSSTNSSTTSHSPKSFLPQPSSSRYSTSSSGNTSNNFDEPDSYYKDFNVDPSSSSNYRSARQNSSMATTVASSPKQPVSSRANPNGSAFTIPRKGYSPPTALRSVSDSANSKLHSTKPNSTINVRERAKQFDQKNNTSQIVAGKGPSKVSSINRTPNNMTLPSDKVRSVSDNVLRSAPRVGQGLRESAAKVPRPPRAGGPRQDPASNAIQSRVREPSQVRGARKPNETMPTSPSLPMSPSAPTKLAEKTLLFGEIASQSATGVGHGIPTGHARSPSDPTADTIVISLQPTETSEVPSQSVQAEPKSPHKRSHSDTPPRKPNVIRRPLHQNPSPRSSTSSETSKVNKPIKSRLPSAKRVNDPSDCSTSSSTRSNSPFTSTASPKAATKPRSGTPSIKTVSRPRLNSGTTVNTAKTSPRSGRPSGSVINRSTAASRNRESDATKFRPSSRAGSSLAGSSRAGSPPKVGSPPKETAKRQIRPAANRDVKGEPSAPFSFSAKQSSIRQNILRRDSVRQREESMKRRENLPREHEDKRLRVYQQVHAEELQKKTAIEEENLEEAPLKVATGSIDINPEAIVKEDKAADTVSLRNLRIDTSLVPEAPADASEDFQQSTDDSPTLGIPGSFPNSLQSPMAEEIPQSAVSNITDTTDIDNDPQDELQIPGGFNGLNVAHLDPENALPTSSSSIDVHNKENRKFQPAGMPDTTDAQDAPHSDQQNVTESEFESPADELVGNAAPQIPPILDHTGQLLIPGSGDFLQSRVHESLRESDEESADDYYSRPSSTFRTSHIDQENRNSDAWTDECPTSGSEKGVGAEFGYHDGIGAEEDYDRPPTPPPKVLSAPSSRNSPYLGSSTPDARPTTPLKSAPADYANPPLPLSPPVPEVPPKPANYSPLPSPKPFPPPAQSPTLGEDAPLSPHSSFGTAAVIRSSDHSRTSSTTPHYSKSTGWTSQPPIPTSRPTSSSMDDTVQAGANGYVSGTEDKVAPPETEEQALARQQEAKALRDRRNIIKEILDSEGKHVKDMYVIKEIWQGTADACPMLTEGDKVILFGNINEIAAFGARFLESLKRANSSVYDARRGPDGKTRSDENSINAEADRKSCVGGIFMQYADQIELVNWPFIIKFQQGQAHLRKLLRDPVIKIWDQECRRAMVDISECWDLPALIIKPYQRMVKYKDLLERLITKTAPDHPDWEKLQQAAATLQDMMKRLNEAMPVGAGSESESSKTKIARGKRKEAESRTGFMKTLARKTMKNTPVAITNPLKPTDKDEDYARLRRAFGEDYVRLQVVLRDVEFYTRQVTESVNSFLKVLGCIEMFVISKPLGPYPELESKWSRFNISMQSIRHTALPNHINLIRTQFIYPFEELIKLYSGPNQKMSERTRRRVDWEKISVGKEKWTFAKDHQRKIEKSAERFTELNQEIKKDLPILSAKTSQIANYCLSRFILVQMDWYNMWQQKVATVLEDHEVKAVLQDLTKTESGQIVKSFLDDYTFINATLNQLTITKKSKASDFKDYASPLGRTSTQESETQFSFKGRDSREQRSRPPSSNGRSRPAPVRTRAASTNGSPSLPTPDFGRHNDGGFFTPMDPNVPLSQTSYGLGLEGPSFRFHDSHSLADTLVNSQPSSSHQSSGRPSINATRSPIPVGGYDGSYDDSYRKHSDVSESAYQARDSESGYFRRESDISDRSYDYYDRSRPVSGSTTFSARIDGPPINGRPSSGLDGPSSSSRPYSGVFQSAMPLSDGPETYNTRMSRTSSLSSLDRNDDRNRGDGYNVLYLAASLFEFHIEDTKREGIYPYLTYEAGELFDVIGEKGELWLAKNQDDPPDKIKVGWIWSKHFARLAD